MAREHDYFVYLLTNATRTVLYIGITSDLEGRLHGHRTGTHRGFTTKYQLNRLAYYEEFGDVLRAIEREKQFKGWRRSKKEALIAKVNPRWDDLSVEWEASRRTHPLYGTDGAPRKS